ncbi:MAG: aldehyde dehydrogenase family protein [Planctomycetaceae bacterium]|nr:aldehyde dehydrogenase family protein [Planctomycetaceae bacterium]
MLEIPVIRWGKPYESLEKADVVHFETGEVMAQMHQANAGLVQMDMRKADKAREVLRQFQPADLIDMCVKAADLFLTATLPMGNGTQTPEEFCSIQSATTGLPLNMARANMSKNAFVLSNMGAMLDALTRGLPLEILSRGYGMESRGVMVSYQSTTPVLGLVLPSNSPGVHTLWLPAIPLQVGLVLKPGSSEPWTPYRMYEAFAAAGVPREAFSLYPGPHDVGNKVLETCQRAMIFGGTATVEKYAGNPRVQAHGPGFSKIMLGDDVVDRWEDYLDILVKSVLINGGRSCINCSGIWASRHTEEIADAIAKQLGPITALPTTDPNAALAANTMAGAAEAMNRQIDEGCESAAVTEMTAKYRDGDRWIPKERCDYLRPTVLHVSDPDDKMANTEYMFPFVSVVKCPQNQMLKKIGSTLVGTAITEDPKWTQELVDARHIDRLNIGPIPTCALNWLQPHEGNIIDFLFRNRAFQNSMPPAH